MQNTYIGGTIRDRNDPSRTRRTDELPFIAGCSHFTRKNTRFRAPASSPKHSPCNIHAAITMRFAAHSFKKRIELRTQEQPLFAKHIGGTIRDRNDPSRTRRTDEVPFIAGCSHFTRKNTRFRAPASSPKHSPCNIHAAITMRFAAHSFKKRIELRTQEQPLVAKHIGGTIRDRNDPSRTRRTDEVPFIAGCSHFTRKNTRFRAPASSPKHSPCNIYATEGHHFPVSPLPFVTFPFSTTSLPHYLPSSPLPFFTTSLLHHFPSSPLPFVTTPLHHHFPSSPLPYLTTSLHHHFPSSPLPFVTTPLHHHFPSSPLPFLTTPLHHHFPSSPLPFVTTSLPHHFPSSPLPFIITSILHRFPSSPLPFLTTSLRRHSPSSSLPFFTTSLRHHFPSSPLPFLTTSLRHHSPSSSLPFVTTSLPHHFPSSPLPFIITSLLHHFPSSPLPFIITSLRHHFPSSPPVIITTLHQSQFHCFLFFCYVLLLSCIVM